PPAPPAWRATLNAVSNIQASPTITNPYDFFSFNLTAVNPGLFQPGYSAQFSYGSISREPISGTTLNTCVTGSVSFIGDARSKLAGRVVWVDGVPYTTGF